MHQRRAGAHEARAAVAILSYLVAGGEIKRLVRPEAAA